MKIADLLVLHDIINHKDNYYNIWFKRKKSKKRNGRYKYREIIAPNDAYKRIQEYFYEYFKQNPIFPIHNSSYAWIQGRSREQCAYCHVGKKYVLEVDINDYFGSIKKHHISNLFEKHNITNIQGLSPDLFIDLITIKKDNNIYVPQGFMTSTYLANAVRYDIDVELQKLADDNNLIYSNYGDNLYFSGDAISPNLKYLIQNILSNYGFSINIDKTKMMPYYRRQEILSIVINKKLNISKDYTNKVIQETLYKLHNNLPADRSLLGKVNILSLAANKRNYKFVKKLIDKMEKQ